MLFFEFLAGNEKHLLKKQSKIVWTLYRPNLFIVLISSPNLSYLCITSNRLVFDRPFIYNMIDCELLKEVI
jgi:hypothetical protein